jgi:UDP-GlcNAc3NAcA epimerase
MKRILCIIGTRPQLIKHSVLLKNLQQQFDVDTINTVQHYDDALNKNLIAELLGEVPIKNIDLNANASPGERLGNMISQLDIMIKESEPDAVLVYGDTDSTLSGAMSAHQNNKKLIHIEAGERSYNNEMPEENNRVLTDRLSSILFCASQRAVENLQAEKIQGDFFYSGDVMKDLLMQTVKHLHDRPHKEPYIYCTLHRNYNQKNKEKLIELISELGKLDQQVYFSAHPGTFETIKECGLHIQPPGNVKFLQPLPYSQSIRMLKFADAVITDSGGLQKEAYWLKTPCITVRTETEWTETLAGGWNHLLYEDFGMIKELLKATRTGYNPELYGNGNACHFITNILKKLIA